MDRFTAALRRSTQQKFRHMGRTALYFTDPAAPNPRTIKVLITDRFQALGDLKGTNFNYAEIEDNTPRIEFLTDEIEPAKSAYVSVERGVAYQIDTVLPPEDITVTANVVRMRADKARNFPVPLVT